MVKRQSILTAVLLVVLTAATARAQTALVYTNNYLDATHAALTGPSGVFRLTTYITDGVSDYDLSGFTGFDIVVDSWVDGEQYTAKTGDLLPDVNNAVRWILPSMPAHTYTLTMTATNDELSVIIGNHVLTVYPSPLPITNDFSVTIGGSTTTVENTTIVSNQVVIEEGAISNNVSVTVIQISTNIYQGDTFSTNLLESIANVDAVAAPTADDALVWNGVAWSNKPIESGSGTITNGIGTNGIMVEISGGTFTVKMPDPIPASDQFWRSDGTTMFWSTDRWPLPEIGTNYVVFDYFTDAPQDFVVPSGVSNIEITCIGGGGSGPNSSSFRGGAGGGTVVVCPVTASETLKVVVARGGLYLTTTNYSSYMGGGKNFKLQIGGGGLSGVYRGDTNNFICIAGGGGAGGEVSGSAKSSGGAGGGIFGGDGSGIISGRGGTQTAGGLGGNNETNLTMGSYLTGGYATNGLNTLGLGSGGGGYFGGGAGFTNTIDLAAAGGGSGYISSNCSWGVTLRGEQHLGVYTVYPPFIDDPLYVVGIGVGNYAGAGGNGRVWIKW